MFDKAKSVLGTSTGVQYVRKNFFFDNSLSNMYFEMHKNLM